MTVFTFHNVLEHSPGAFSMLARKEWLSLRTFEKQLDDIAARYRVVPLDEIAEAIRIGAQPAPGVCALTFDDGNLGSFRHAAPLLEARGLPATFFVVTGRLENGASRDAFDLLEALLFLTERDEIAVPAAGTDLLTTDCDDCKARAFQRLAKLVRAASPDERAALFTELRRACEVPEADLDRYLSHEAYQSMTWDGARDLARRGFAVGSHGRTHVALSRVDGDALANEVAGSYQALAAHLAEGAGPFAFSYPFGKAKHISETSRAAVREAGFSCAVTMERGEDELFRIGRIVYKEAKKLGLL